MKFAKKHWKLLAILLIGIALLTDVCAVNITQFHDGAVRKRFIFQESYMSDYFYITLPLNNTVIYSTINITGDPLPAGEPKPVDIAMITDVSGSMLWRFGTSNAAGVERPCDSSSLLSDDTQRLQLTKCVSYEFIDNILNRSSESRIGLVSYSTTSTLEMGYSNDSQTLKNEVLSYSAEGRTCIPCALQTAINIVMTSSDPDHKQYIVLMTDGETNTMLSGDHDEAGSRSESRYLADLAASYGITIYAIAFGPIGEDPLRYIAEVTGGTYNVAMNPEQVKEIYNRIIGLVVYTNYPQPSIDTNKWVISTPLSGSAIWANNDCGDPVISCVNFADMLNNALSSADPLWCTPVSCTIPLLLDTNIEGMVTLSDLFINTKATIPPPIIIPSSEGCDEFHTPVNGFLEIPLSSYVLNTPPEFQSWSNTPEDPAYFKVSIDSNHVATISSPGTTQQEGINFTVTDIRTDLSSTKCFSFNSHLSLYGISTEEATRLLISGSKFIYNYYESPLTGELTGWGPYLITIKVWQEK